jgi:hypothetical protein
MSDPISRGDLPTERDDPPGDDSENLQTYDAMADVDGAGEDVYDISQNDGPELTTGVADIDTGSSGGHGTAARGDDTGTETPPRALPDDEP